MTSTLTMVGRRCDSHWVECFTSTWTVSFKCNVFSELWNKSLKKIVNVPHPTFKTHTKRSKTNQKDFYFILWTSSSSILVCFNTMFFNATAVFPQNLYILNFIFTVAVVSPMTGCVLFIQWLVKKINKTEVSSNFLIHAVFGIDKWFFFTSKEEQYQYNKITVF